MTAPDRIVLYRRIMSDKWHLAEAGETMSHGNAEYAEYTRATPAAMTRGVPTEAQITVVARALHAQRKSLVHWDTMSAAYRSEFEVLARQVFRDLAALRVGDP